MTDDFTSHVNTVLGHEEFWLASFNGVEELSRVSMFNMRLLSRSPSVQVDRLLHQPMSVSLKRGNGLPRHFHGIASSVVQAGRIGENYEYEVELVPWLWLLSLG